MSKQDWADLKAREIWASIFALHDGPGIIAAALRELDVRLLADNKRLKAERDQYRHEAQVRADVWFFELQQELKAAKLESERYQALLKRPHEEGCLYAYGEQQARRELEDAIRVCNQTAEALGRARLQRDDVLAKVGTLFDAIAHGDEAHRAWLKEAINKHFEGHE
jgi:hypothetical protein